MRGNKREQGEQEGIRGKEKELSPCKEITATFSENYQSHRPQSLPPRLPASDGFQSQFHLCVATATVGSLPCVNKILLVLVVL